MTVKRVAVVGASGHLGHIIASALLDSHAIEVVLLTTHEPIRHSTAHTSGHRKEQLLAELVARGAQCYTVHFDDTPALHKALEQVECVISCLGGPHFESMQRHLIDVLLSLPQLRLFFPAEFGAPPPNFIQPLIQGNNGMSDRRSDDPNDEVRQLLDRYGPRLGAVWRTQRRLRAQTSPTFQTIYLYCGLMMDATLWPWFGIDVRHGRAQLVGDGRATVSLTHRADVARIVCAIVTGKIYLPINVPHLEVRIAAESMPMNDVIRRYEYVQNRIWQVSHVPVNQVWPFMRIGRTEHEPYDTELYDSRALKQPELQGSLDPDTLALRLLAAEGYLDILATGTLDNDMFDHVPHSMEVGLRAAVPKSKDWDFVTMQEKLGKPAYAGTKGFITLTAWIQEQIQLLIQRI